ncbi:hypothetical protein FQN50_008510 [Emmonsiellopsis sp. PD_5]|nr:hypothetical protein FQN50_008510 [Emmonsiellopsis sp. PD_5]
MAQENLRAIQNSPDADRVIYELQSSNAFEAVKIWLQKSVGGSSATGSAQKSAPASTANYLVRHITLSNRLCERHVNACSYQKGNQIYGVRHSQRVAAIYGIQRAVGALHGGRGGHGHTASIPQQHGALHVGPDLKEAGG